MKLYSKIYETLNKKINLSKEGLIALGLASITIVSGCSNKIDVTNTINPSIIENIDYEIDKTIKEINKEEIYEITFFESTLTIKENKKSTDYSKIKYLFELLNNQQLEINYIPCEYVNIDFSEFNLDNCYFSFTFQENKINKKRLSKIIKNISNCINITVQTDELNYIDEIVEIINLIGNNDTEVYKSLLIDNNSKTISKIIDKITINNSFNSFVIKSDNCKEYLGDLSKINSDSISVIVSNYDYVENSISISASTNNFKLYYNDGNSIKLVYEYNKDEPVIKDNVKLV